MHVAIDLDDVTVDFMPGVLHAFETEYGVKVPFNGDAWSVDAIVKHPLLLESGYKSWWEWLKDREWLWANFSAVPGAIGGIARLRADGHYVEAVTSKPDWAEHNVWKWLGKWRPRFHRVTIVGTGQSKTGFTDAAVMVDDKLDTCVEFARDGRKGVLFDRAIPLRQLPSLAVPAGGGLYQATSWSEVVDTIRTIERGTQ